MCFLFFSKIDQNFCNSCLDFKEITHLTFSFLKKYASIFSLTRVWKTYVFIQGYIHRILGTSSTFTLMVYFFKSSKCLHQNKNTNRILSHYFRVINQRSFLFYNKEFTFIFFELSLSEELKLDITRILGKFGTIGFKIC